MKKSLERSRKSVQHICFLTVVYGFMGFVKKIYISLHFLFLFATLPFHFMKSKDSYGSVKSHLSPPLPPPCPFFQPLSRPSTTFTLYILFLVSFSFFTPLKNHPFLFLCSFCVARQPCNCGPYEEQDEHRRSVPMYSHSPSSLCSRSIVIG